MGILREVVVANRFRLKVETILNQPKNDNELGLRFF